MCSATRRAAAVICQKMHPHHRAVLGRASRDRCLHRRAAARRRTGKPSGAEVGQGGLCSLQCVLFLAAWTGQCWRCADAVVWNALLTVFELTRTRGDSPCAGLARPPRPNCRVQPHAQRPATSFSPGDEPPTSALAPPSSLHHHRPPLPLHHNPLLRPGAPAYLIAQEPRTPAQLPATCRAPALFTSIPLPLRVAAFV